MERLIEVPDIRECSAPLPLNIGDTLFFHASGARIVSGSNVVQMFGPLIQAVLGNDCTILTPMGAPNAVLIRAQRIGVAVVEVITGDPWQNPETTRVELTVER